MEYNTNKSININILCAQHSVLEENLEFKTEGDNFSRLYLLEGGKFELSINGVRQTVNKNTMCIVPSGSKMKYRCRSDVSIKWIHFIAILSNSIDMLRHYSIDKYIFQDVAGKYVAAFDELILNFSLSDPLIAIVCAENISKLLHFVATESNATLRKVDMGIISRLQKAVDFIDDNISKPIKVSELAKIAHLSQGHFSRLFKTYYDNSPSDFILQRKLDLAKQLLITSEMPISGISERLGFYDLFHFSKTFKHYIKMPPSKYRKLQKQILP